jgi:hypothetical protein
MDTTEKRVWVKGGSKTGHTSNFSVYTYSPQNIYTGCVCVCDKYLHWPCVSVK